ncbi:MAG TPA: Rieske 2Fe-2S domain-containing protein [Planctomycetota bacterium]|nr:Rieske 2Fe-2S domain-containing protein [Planctomycetota bacterium]
MRWERTIPSAAIPPGRPAAAFIGPRKVLVARLEDGTVVAANPRCPHQGADLTDGGTVYMGAIDCPWHHYLYDLRTGENRYPREVFPADLACALKPLRLLPAREEPDGYVYVGVEGEG